MRSETVPITQLDLKLPELLWPEAQAHYDAYDQARGEYVRVGREFNEARSRRAQMKAQTRDQREYVNALEAGKPDPGEVNEKDREKRVAALRRETNARREIKEDRRIAFLQHMLDNQEPYLADIEARLRGRRSEAVDRPTDDVLREFTTLLAWRNYLVRFPYKPHRLLPARITVGVRGMDLPIEHVLTALRNAIHAA